MNFTENNSAAYIPDSKHIQFWLHEVQYVPCHVWLDFVDLFCVGYMLVIVEMYAID